MKTLFILFFVIFLSIVQGTTVRLKNDVNQNLQKTEAMVKQTKKELHQFEEAMEEKKMQQGLNEKGKEDLVRSQEHMKFMNKMLRQRSQTAQSPSLSEKEAKTMDKLAYKLSQQRKRALNAFLRK
jgi:hypothetical protein